MKILLVHNYYQQSGGEYSVYKAEEALLKQHGHEVVTYNRHNDEFRDQNWIQHLGAFPSLLWSSQTIEKLTEIIQIHRPDIAHFHNTFPLITSSGYYSCQKFGVPVVQTLHNYRMQCAASSFFRDGAVCEDCLGKTIPYPAIIHKCYRDSWPESIVASSVIAYNNIQKSWKKHIDGFIAPSEFVKRKYIEMGLLEEQIFIKSHFLNTDPGMRSESEVEDYFAFAGRLAIEKGILTLIEAWRDLPLSLKVIGDGPLMAEIRKKIEIYGLKDRVTLLGKQSRESTISLIRKAKALIVPSTVYEVFGLVVAEAFSQGTPVIGADIGALPSLIRNNDSGLMFEPSNPLSLKQQVIKLNNNPQQASAMSHNGRSVFLQNMMPDKNHDRLLEIYDKIIEKKRYHQQ